MSDKTPKSQRGRPKKLTARVTHLEMTTRHSRNIPLPTRPTLALMRVRFIPANYYHFLYELVGKPYHWEARRNMKDDKLYDLINAEDCEIHILYADGCPAGFFELSKQKMPEAIEIVYFGIGEDYQGIGLGKWFASAAVSAAWNHKPEKITVQTNTLDHPAALPLYQKLGFTPVAISEEKITPWV